MKRLSLIAAVLGLVLLCSGISQAATCPALGNIGAGCNVLITLNSGGTVTITIPNSTPYDGSDDQLVGVQNNSGGAVGAINITGVGIFALDGDGGWAPGGACVTVGGNANGCFTPSIVGNPGDYSGPNTSFAISNANSGTVSFSGGLANGGFSFFTLEAPPVAGGFNVTVGTVPEPNSVVLIGSVLAAVAWRIRRRRVKS